MVRPTPASNGLFTFLFEGVCISAAISGVRRTTGLNVYELWIKNNVSSSPLKIAIKAYLNAGEFVVDKGLDLYSSKKSSDAPAATSSRVDGRVDDQRSDGKYRY